MRKLFSCLVLGAVLLLGLPSATFAYGGSGTIDNVNPTSFKPGDVITITGSGFGSTQSSSDVEVNYNSIYSSGGYYQSWSDNQIVVKIPSYFSYSGQLQVRVSNYSSGKYYTIDGPTVYAAPTLASVTPQIVYPNQEITLGCNSFLTSCFGETQGSVMVGGTGASIKSWSGYQIVAIVPGLSAGQYGVTVRNPAGGESDAKQITIKAAPTVYSIDPSQIVPGVTRVCLVGENFGAAAENWTSSTELMMGNTPITLAAWTDKKICFDAPSSLTQGGMVTLKIKGYSVPSAQSYYISNGNTSGGSSSGQSVGKQYYLNQINATTGWNIQKESPNVTVAVIDDGIYLNHPYLAPNTWINNREVLGNKKDDDKNGYVDDIYGYDFLGNTPEMTARGSHGTHVAGIIGAVQDQASGVSGITQKVKLMSLIACDPKIGCPTSAVVKAIRYAADNGADVINLSLGSQGVTTYSNDYDDAISYAYNKGVIIVAAGGNGDLEGGIGQDTGFIPVSPVCNKSDQGMTLGVGAVDDQGKRMYWSNYGKCVKVYAPGKAIYSTTDPVYDNQQFFSSADGTSFSAPMVSGLAALMRGKYPTIPNYEVINRIIRNTNSGVIDVNKTLLDAYTPTISVPSQNNSNPNQANVTTTGTHEVGINVKSPDGTISMIAPDGTRRPYTSAGAFLSYAFNSFSGVVDATAGDLALPQGSFIPPRDGKIMCSDRGSDKGTCYLVSGGAKAAFTSSKVFTGLGFSFAKSSKGDVSWMTGTSNIDNTQSAHISGVLINDKGTYYIITDRGTLGIPDATTLQSWGYSFTDAVPANDSDRLITQAGILPIRTAGQLTPQ